MPFSDRTMNKKYFSNDIFIPQVTKFISKGYGVNINVNGSSMRPFIEGQRSEVMLIPAKKIQVGDIVLARIDTRYILHRIIKITANYIVLQGDGNISRTEICKKEDVIAKCDAIIKKSNGHTRYTHGIWWNTKCRLWYFFRPIRQQLLAIYRLKEFGHLHNSKIKYEN